MEPSRIKEARKAANMTQAELADLVGINRATISKYEAGEITPSLEMLEDISRALDCEVGYLLGFENYGGGFWGKPLSEDDPRYRNLADNILKFHGPQSEWRKRYDEAFSKLNDEGRRVAVERVEELAEIPKYRKDAGDGEK